MIVSVLTGVTLSVAVPPVGLSLSGRIDKDIRHGMQSHRDTFVAFAICAFVAAFMSAISVMFDFSGGVVSGLFWGSLGAAAYCDHCCQEVHDFIYLPAVVACIFAFICNPVGIIFVIECAFFCLVQGFVFSRFYGGSDCVAYCVCSAYIAALGGGLFEDILVMIMSFGLFVMVQSATDNMCDHMKLKHPKALIPYIGIGMAIYQVIRCFHYASIMGAYIR